MAVPGRIMLGEPSLPDIAGEKLLVIWFVITPGKADIAKPTTRGMFPFRLTGKASANPGGIGGSVIP